MKLKTLAQLRRPALYEKILGSLPENVLISVYAKQKAFKICELVGAIFQRSYEWYGFTLADKDHPELVLDIGLPKNDLNLNDYATISPATIAEFQETLPHNLIINGWIHSHGSLQYKHFSDIDEKNHRNVLDFVAARTRRPLEKKELAINDLVLLVKGCFEESDLEKGTVSLITDAAITEAKILETVYGSFCYCVVVGDGGWHEQAIQYQKRRALSALIRTKSISAQMTVVETERSFTQLDVDILAGEVKAKIRPNLNPPVETMERM